MNGLWSDAREIDLSASQSVSAPLNVFQPETEAFSLLEAASPLQPSGVEMCMLLVSSLA